jgi:serine/threonine-protein kinase RsbW
MEPQNQSIRLVVPADAEYIDIVRLTLYGIATRMGFSYEAVEDMKIAVTEACNNVVLHAYQVPSKGIIEIEFEMFEDKFCINVKDNGNSFDIDYAVNRADSLHHKRLEEVEIGGLGIFLMNSLMDDVDVRIDGGTRVVLTKWLTNRTQEVDT